MYAALFSPNLPEIFIWSKKGKVCPITNFFLMLMLGVP